MIHTQTTCPIRITLRAGKKGAHSAGVGALASVFEKSATELKQQTKMQTHSTDSNIGQLQELTASAIEHRIDIICIQEHRYTHSEDITRYWQWMDASHCISMEKLCQCNDRRSRYAYRTTSPKITK